MSFYSPILEPLIRTLKVLHPKEDLDLIIRAFEVADKAHAGQRRKSGDPYITHPVAELLDVHVDQFARPIPFVAHGGVFEARIT